MNLDEQSKNGNVAYPPQLTDNSTDRLHAETGNIQFGHERPPSTTGILSDIEHHTNDNNKNKERKQPAPVTTANSHLTDSSRGVRREEKETAPGVPTNLPPE